MNTKHFMVFDSYGYMRLSESPKNVETHPTGWGDEVYYHDELLGTMHIPTRTKYSHPYSYDPIVQYDAGGKATGTIYSDRLYGWDPEKHDRLCKKHFGDVSQHWTRSPSKIQAFLCDWLEKKVVLVRVIEYCNESTGYPVWRLDFREKM